MAWLPFQKISTLVWGGGLLILATKITNCSRFDHGACVPLRVHTVVVSVQHSENVTLAVLREDIRNKVIKQVIPENFLDENTIFHINPCGDFHIGGPMGDAGDLLTHTQFHTPDT